MYCARVGAAAAAPGQAPSRQADRTNATSALRMCSLPLIEDRTSLRAASSHPGSGDAIPKFEAGRRRNAATRGAGAAQPRAELGVGGDATAVSRCRGMTARGVGGRMAAVQPPDQVEELEHADEMLQRELQRTDELLLEELERVDEMLL